MLNKCCLLNILWDLKYNFGTDVTDGIKKKPHAVLTVFEKYNNLTEKILNNVKFRYQSTMKKNTYF